jgi:CRP-like cAMP-binding protein
MGMLRGGGRCREGDAEDERADHGGLLSGNVRATLVCAGRLEYDPDHMLQPPFDDFDIGSLARLAVEPGDRAFREGAAATAIFAALDVPVTLHRTTAQGDRVVIHRARPGETFAEASLFADVYHCDAVAEGRGTVLRLDRRAVLERFSDPGFARAVARLMARQVQRYRMQVQIMTIRSAEERVFAAMALGLLEGSVVDFAASIGLTHEATYRALKRLVAVGRVSKPGRGKYVLPG